MKQPLSENICIGNMQELFLAGLVEMGHSVFLIFHNFQKNEISHYFTSREREEKLFV